MLVLIRNDGERVMIGDDIIVTVVHAGRGHVKLGITAPKDVLVLREELLGKRPGETPREPPFGDEASPSGE